MILHCTPRLHGRPANAANLEHTMALALQFLNNTWAIPYGFPCWVLALIMSSPSGPPFI